MQSTLARTIYYFPLQHGESYLFVAEEMLGGLQGRFFLLLAFLALFSLLFFGSIMIAPTTEALA